MRRYIGPCVGGFLAGLLFASVGSTLARGRRVRDAENVAARALGQAIQEHVDSHSHAVAALAERFGRWEAMPEEALARSLTETLNAFPGFQSLMVASPDGHVMAASTRVGAEVARGELDPCEERRTAMRQAFYAPPSPWVGAREQKLVLAVLLRRTAVADGSHAREGVGYVAADLLPSALAKLLGRAEELWPARIGLLGPRGEVLYPQDNRPVPKGALRVEVGGGLILTVDFTRSSR
ncbi:MAG: cache domain-containing protein [Deltaproteobacteria bacterium]|nr:cache domain-containing protein [Deltaproteobacteria bacterium]